MLQTLVDLMKENGFTLAKARSRITDTKYTDDIVLLENTPIQSLLHSLEWTAGGIGFHVNTDKTVHILLIREATSIGLTHLYFKIAVMPLVSETKMADGSKLISLRNLLVRKVTWLVLTMMSATSTLSRAFGADCMTRIAYIYSHL